MFPIGKMSFDSLQWSYIRHSVLDYFLQSYLYPEDILINITYKYVSIYVSIKPMGYEKLKWSYIWQ